MMETGSSLVPDKLLQKYGTRGPRYTSYPTAPEWTTLFTEADTLNLLTSQRDGGGDLPLSLYLHIPFCIRLCYYCGCNRIITHNSELVERYLRALEWEVPRWAAALGTLRPVVQVHLGGGTPTHLSPDQLRRVFGLLADHFSIVPDAEISIEVHPVVTTEAHLETLRDLGFNRLSMGVQDFDPEVQKIVNRLQTFELTEALVLYARRLGFRSINTDLMYGLPLQTVPKFRSTLDRIDALAPDRVALFNYAHVPHIQPGQKLIPIEALPAPDVKRDLFQLALEHFLARGYRYIGMDHFARPDDELSQALDERTLRRNFMGYTTCKDSLVIAFGASSISDLETAYLQNHRAIKDYFDAIEQRRLPVARGIRLTEDDRLRRDVINRLICHSHLEKAEIEQRYDIDFDLRFAEELQALAPLEVDGLVRLSAASIEVTPRGQFLLRNVCMPFDAYLKRNSGEPRVFSSTV